MNDYMQVNVSLSSQILFCLFLLYFIYFIIVWVCICNHRACVLLHVCGSQWKSYMVSSSLSTLYMIWKQTWVLVFALFDDKHLSPTEWSCQLLNLVLTFKYFSPHKLFCMYSLGLYKWIHGKIILTHSL